MTKGLGLTLLAGVLLGFTVSTASADELEAVEKKIITAWDRHKTITARMVTTVHLQMSTMVLDGRGEGTVEMMKKGGKLLMRMELKKTITRSGSGQAETKSEQQFKTIIDGNFTYTVTTTDVLDQEEPKQTAVKSFIEPKTSLSPKILLRYLHQKKSLRLLPEETVDGKTAFVIETTPKAEGAQHLSVMRKLYYFQQESGCLVKTVMYSPAGEPATVVSWTDLRFDVDLDPDRFVFRPPFGVPVLDYTRDKPNPNLKP